MLSVVWGQVVSLEESSEVQARQIPLWCLWILRCVSVVTGKFLRPSYINPHSVGDVFPSQLCSIVDASHASWSSFPPLSCCVWSMPEGFLIRFIKVIKHLVKTEDLTFSSSRLLSPQPSVSYGGAVRRRSLICLWSLEWTVICQQTVAVLIGLQRCHRPALFISYL